jgi:hypothetical protein
MSSFLLALLLAAPGPDVDPQKLKAHVDFLASDLLEGRETGTRGYDVAAAYVASQYAQAGLEPAGTDGSWFHRVPLQASRIVPAESAVCVRHGAECAPLVHPDDIVLSPDMFRDVSVVNAPLVFAGFGVSAPGLKHDDYAGLEVRGRIVVVMNGAPARFPPTQRAYHGNASVKAKEAATRGAVGLLTVRTLESERRYPWERFSTMSSRVGMRATIDGVPLDAFPGLLVAGTLSRASAAKAWQGAPVGLDTVLAASEKGEPRPGRLATSLEARVTSKRWAVESVNVAGLLRGSDPTRAGEHVVVTGHLDHLGVREDAQGDDNIRNGALDNASGIAAVLEMARLLAASPRPARSVLFLAVTAEEKGLQGSRAFGERPTVPLASIVANVNLDMITAIYPLKSLVAMGAEHSSLGPLARAAAEEAGYSVVAEMEPEEMHFVRSDQFSFVRKGVPAIAFRAAPASSDPAVDAAAVHEHWKRNVYHSVDDEATQAIDYPSMARWGRANLGLVRAIAEAGERPRWNPGDDFGRLFGSGR